jgi:hypothetical protein
MNPKRIERPGADLLLPGAIVLAILVYLSFAPALFNDGDTSWHIAAGRWMIASGDIPRTDPFSFTHAGRPWTAHEWLSELAMAGAFAIGSWDALALLFATSVAATLGIIALEARRAGLPPPAIAAFLLFSFIIVIPYIVARPHLLSWPLLAGWTVLMLRAREHGHAPPLPAASLMLVWANLHGSFLFGLLLILPFGLEALLAGTERLRTALRWGGFFLVSLLAALATPHGLEGLTFPLEVSRMESLPLIMEWRATVPAENPAFIMTLAATFAFALVKRVRVEPVRLLLILLLLYMAFAHVRHQALLAIIGALLLIEPVARALQVEAGQATKRLPRGAIAWLAGLVLLAWVVRLPFDRPPGDSGSNPRSAIERVPARLRGLPVMNGYGFGGPLILSGIRPFIDGRADLYGDAHMFEHQRIIDGDRVAFDRAVRQWGIRWTILPPESRLAARLDREPAWRRIHADRWAVIHVAETAAPRTVE